MPKNRQLTYLDPPGEYQWYLARKGGARWQPLPGNLGSLISLIWGDGDVSGVVLTPALEKALRAGDAPSLDEVRIDQDIVPLTPEEYQALIANIEGTAFIEDDPDSHRLQYNEDGSLEWYSGGEWTSLPQKLENFIGLAWGTGDVSGIQLTEELIDALQSGTAPSLIDVGIEQGIDPPGADGWTPEDWNDYSERLLAGPDQVQVSAGGEGGDEGDDDQPGSLGEMRVWEGEVEI